MTPSDREPTGQRIARARRRRGLSQAVLAGLVGRSESWLSQVERGKRGVDSHSVLVRLAEVLRVDIEELTGSADRDETGRHAYTAAPLIEQAMMGYGTPSPLDSGDEPEREANLDFLRAQARSAYRAYQATPGRPARNRYQLSSVTPTYTRPTAIVHRQQTRPPGIPPSPRNLQGIDA